VGTHGQERAPRCAGAWRSGTSLEAVGAARDSYRAGGDCGLQLAVVRASAELALQGGHGLIWGGELRATWGVRGVVGSAAVDPA
jgi:hypothetical protein